MAHAGRVTRSGEPVLVTTARKSPRQEQRERERRYLITMGVRVVCFVLAIVLFGLHLRWAAGVAVAGSLLLPWIAVVMANAGPKRIPETPSLYAPDRRKIESGD
jgi:Flp pilus assembly protein TadB